MAFSALTSTQIQPAKAVKTELWTKVKDNFDDHESRLVAQESGGSIIELVNMDFRNASSAATMTGLFYYKATYDFTVTKVEIQIFDKEGITSGSLTVDVKKNSTPDNTGMTSILSVLPTLDFSSCADYDSNSGTLDAGEQDILEGEFLRVDITALPASKPLGKFRLVITGAL